MTVMPVKYQCVIVVTMFFLSLTGCDSQPSSMALDSTQDIAGLWTLKSVGGVSLPEDQTAILVIVTEESSPTGLGAPGSGCSGATVAEFVSATGELALVEESLSSSSSERCFVSLPINQSAQLSLQQLITSGARAELEGDQLVLTNIRDVNYIFELADR